MHKNDKKERTFLTPSRRNEVAHAQQWKCAGVCKELLPPTWCMDHIVALRDGGSNDLKNFQALCANCHALKTLKENQRYHDTKRFLQTIQTIRVLTCETEGQIEKPNGSGNEKGFDLGGDEVVLCEQGIVMEKTANMDINTKTTEEKETNITIQEEEDDDDNDEAPVLMNNQNELRRKQMCFLESFRFSSC